MITTIKQKGRILFDPIDYTNKQKAQASWKKVAMVVIDGDICEYYSWLLKKKYRVILNKPLRNSHVTIISDKVSDMNDKWDEVKSKWGGKEIELYINIDVRTSGEHWWLNVIDNDLNELNTIREELGLNKPFFPFHLTVGYANEKHIDHSNYIHKLITKGLIIN
jgi:hypothetical protein